MPLWSSRQVGIVRGCAPTTETSQGGPVGVIQASNPREFMSVYT